MKNKGETPLIIYPPKAEVARSNRVGSASLSASFHGVLPLSDLTERDENARHRPPPRDTHAARLFPILPQGEGRIDDHARPMVLPHPAEQREKAERALARHAHVMEF